MTTIIRLAALAICVISGSWANLSARAANIPLVNPTFSLPAQPSFTAAAGSFLGWTASGGGAGVLNYTAASGSPTTEAPYWPSVPAGTTFAYSNSDSLTQISTTPAGIITAGTTYQLLVDAGQRFDDADNHQTNTVALIAADGTPLASFTTPNSIGSFSAETITFTASLSSPGLGQQIGVQISSSGVQTNFDLVRLSTVPEPSSFILCGLGALGLYVAARRRKA